MVNFNPPLEAFDQDKGINASLEYSILQGIEKDQFLKEKSYYDVTRYYNLILIHIFVYIFRQQSTLLFYRSNHWKIIRYKENRSGSITNYKWGHL